MNTKIISLTTIAAVICAAFLSCSNAEARASSGRSSGMSSSRSFSTPSYNRPSFTPARPATVQPRYTPRPSIAPPIPSAPRPVSPSYYRPAPQPYAGSYQKQPGIGTQIAGTVAGVAGGMVLGNVLSNGLGLNGHGTQAPQVVVQNGSTPAGTTSAAAAGQPVVPQGTQTEAGQVQSAASPMAPPSIIYQQVPTDRSFPWDTFGYFLLAGGLLVGGWYGWQAYQKHKNAKENAMRFDPYDFDWHGRFYTIQQLAMRNDDSLAMYTNSASYAASLMSDEPTRDARKTLTSLRVTVDSRDADARVGNTIPIRFQFLDNGIAADEFWTFKINENKNPMLMGINVL